METEAVVAVIVGGFALLGALVEFGRRQNHNDHGEVTRSLDRIEGKIDGHINDHAKGDL